MNPERWERVAGICRLAFERSGAERASFLDQACGSDVPLRAEVESLLGRDAVAGSFLEPPSSVDAAGFLDAAPDRSLVGRRIGAYTIRGTLGRGGMGVVYEAEQDNPRRTVALKLIRPGLATAEILRRFSHEAHVLGRLAHPGIAQIFEAGTADSAAAPQPFFAMEVVAGEPITAYARAQALSTRARLELFTAVCDAVQYAHEKGVLHRDLKPGNILVTRDRRPKVLDFGVARATDDGEQVATAQTAAGALIGTLAYMSPEQVRGDARDLDTRSDIYALGVVLYELATDRLPYELAGKSIGAVARIIAEQRPAALRTIRRDLPADLDTIIQKSLEKDRERRYASADALAGDIRRFLANRPILARPPSTAYQLRKFVGRNRAASAIVAALILGLVGLTATSLKLAGRYADQRDAATRAAAEERVARRSADEVVKFLESLLASAEPYASRENEPTLADVVSQAEARLTELDDEPLVQARVLTALGGVFVARAKYERANELLDRALAIRTAKLGAEHPEIAATLDKKCSAYSAAGQHPQAIAAASSALAIVEHARGREHLETAAALTSLGTMQFNARALDGAVASFEEALAIRRRLLGDEHLEVADALGNLGHAYREAGRVPEAVPLLRESLQIRECRLGDSPGVCEALQSLALATFAADREETLRLVERRLAVTRRLYHAKHPAVADALNNLAFMRAGTDAPAACDLHAEALAIRRESLGDDHPLVADSLNELGVLLSNRGDWAGAERCHVEALEIRRKHFGPRDIRVSHSMNSLADTYRKAGRFNEAAELAERVLDLWRELYGPAHAMVGVAHQNAGATYAALNVWERAAEHLQTSAEIYSKLEHPNLASALQLLGAMNLARGRFVAAESHLRRALDVVRAMPAPEPLRFAPVLSNLGVVLNLLDHPQEARAALEEALRFYRQVLAPGDAVLFPPLVNLGEVLLRDDPRTAETVLDEALALEPKLSRDDPAHGDLLAARGLLALAHDCPDQALVQLRAALIIHERKWGAGHWKVESTRARCGACLAQLEQWPDADAALAASLPVLETTFGESHPETRRAADALIRVRAPRAKRGP